ncbi:hypothetical protein [Clostridium pasteurianum]|nr:hypothetical protein [Clostridium pasteurianum]
MEMEAKEHYREMSKIGKRELMSKGPLICLDEILKNEEIVANVDLGTLEIPLKK